MSQFTDPKAPGWQFTATEVSAGVLRVDGVHEDGRSVSRVGTDHSAVLQECVEDAIGLPERRRR